MGLHDSHREGEIEQTLPVGDGRGLEGTIRMETGEISRVEDRGREYWERHLESGSLMGKLSQSHLARVWPPGAQVDKRG